MSRVANVSTLVAAVLLILPGLPAAAAPQILGVVAGAAPRPLTCTEQDCGLYLSSFCIQRDREPPAPGTAYTPAPNGAALTLVVTTDDGAILRLPAAAHLRFESYAGYTAVRAGLSRAELERLGGVAVALEVGPRATLIPAPVAGDPDPLSEQEIALATGAWRTAAERVFEAAGQSPEAAGAGVLSVLINALPERGRAGPALRDGVWARVAEAGAFAGRDPAAVEAARVAFGVCRGFTRGATQKPLRRCLEARHDAWMMGLNEAYWDELAGW